MGDLLQWLEHHDHHDGGTVRVGDDATRTVQSILCVTLRHHEGHILIHTEGT